MHNSLHIRDLLRRTNAGKMFRERRDPHRWVTRDPLAQAGEGEFEMIGDWQIRCEQTGDAAKLIKEDVRDFLGRMGVAVSENADHMIQFAQAGDLGDRDVRLDLAAGQVRIEAGGVAGWWAGVAWLEWEMATRRGPFLPVGTMERRAAWPVQISQGPWGGNYSVPDFSAEYLSDESFRLYAHYGVNSMMIYGDLLCYADSELLPELNCPEAKRNLATLRDAAERAARYGVEFTYVPVGPKLRRSHPLFKRLPALRGSGHDWSGKGEETIHCLCSSDPMARTFYRETFEALFRHVPQLRGVILIVAEESMYHCKMHAPSAQELCPRCGGREVEDVIVEMVSAVEQGVHAGRTDAFVLAWPYSTNLWPRPDRLEFIRRLPPSIGVMQTLEKDQWLEKDGYRKRLWDYSIEGTAASDNTREVRALTQRTHHPMFIKTETGIGLELIQVPYVPAMFNLAEKWKAVRDLTPDGVHQAWLFFGMVGSRAESLGLWAAYGGDMSMEAFLRRLACRDFGPDAAETVLRSWRHMSEAMRHLPMIPGYYVGPGFLGPAHPLVPQRDAVVPDVFYANLFYLQETEQTFAVRQINEARRGLVLTALPQSISDFQIEATDPHQGWEVVIREYDAAAKESHEAWQALKTAAAAVRTEGDEANLREETLLTELIFRTNTTCRNTYMFLQERDRPGHDDGRLQRMRRIAGQERANAQAALAIYEGSPWLDVCHRIDGHYASCIDMIEAKLAWLDDWLGAE